MENKKIIEIYTDGSCIPNPGKGGWAYTIIDNDKEIINSGNNNDTTNIRMELTAVINALSYIKENYIEKEQTEIKVVLNTDSEYVKNGITLWIINWKKNGWKTSNKKKVKNSDLWIQLDKLNMIIDIQWNWIPSHSGIKYNDLCDSLAKKEINKIK